MDTSPNPLPTQPEPNESTAATVPVEPPAEAATVPEAPDLVAVDALSVKSAAAQPSILDEEAQSKLDDSRYDYKVVEVNLFVGHNDVAPATPAPAVVAAAAAPVVSAATETKAGPRPRRFVWWYVGLVAVLLAAGGGATYWFGFRTTAGVAVVATPTPATPTPSPSLSPSPSPSSTPSSTPTPVVLQPQTVTAPSVAPTAAKPQPVTVTSANGLWLRSSPNSSSSKNIIGWIPNHGVVSVDQTGSFWWHGSYDGKTGYFAANYTK